MDEETTKRVVEDVLSPLLGKRGIVGFGLALHDGEDTYIVEVWVQGRIDRACRAVPPTIGGFPVVVRSTGPIVPLGARA
jgi:hypothetical protein